jgi:hypothetical protein
MILDKKTDQTTLDWLLEKDDPGVRYLALRDLVKMPECDPQFVEAKQQAYESGPIAHVLKHMNPDGYWSKPGPGYSPKYRSTVWALILLAQLGASVEQDERIHLACRYLLEHAYAEGGYFSHNGEVHRTFDCLQGNLCWALTALGCQDTRLEQAYEWMARSVTGEGVAPLSEKNAARRFYDFNCGPMFRCAANDGLPCAWGAAKVMMAFSLLPEDKITKPIKHAIQTSVDFIFSVEPTSASWPYRKEINRAWWKFGFPVYYVTDLLQIAEAMVPLGYGHDPRMKGIIQLILDKADDQVRWKLENEYNAKTWGSYGTKGEPNKWVTIRARRVLSGISLISE